MLAAMMPAFRFSAAYARVRQKRAVAARCYYMAVSADATREMSRSS